jgi:hypothetical protein
MEHIRKRSIRTGVQIGWGAKYNMHPENGEGCVGKGGIDKSYTLDRVIELAYNMSPRPNIIMKAGPNTKWYLKLFQKEEIDGEIEKAAWAKKVSNVMYIIEWD